MHKDNISVTRTYENAWFRVDVRNRDTGDIAAEDGAGRTNFFENQRQLVVWNLGNYTVKPGGKVQRSTT